MLKILVVEDRLSSFLRIKEELPKEEFTLLHAKTLKEGWGFFQVNPDIDLILMDACVPGHAPNSMPLVKKIILAGFTKPIIACSTLSEYNQKLIDAGATHQTLKDYAGDFVLELTND